MQNIFSKRGLQRKMEDISGVISGVILCVVAAQYKFIEKCTRSRGVSKDKIPNEIAHWTVGACNVNTVASVKPVVKTTVRCGHWNRTGHSSKDRTWQNCPAFAKNCRNCDKKEHFKVMFKAKDRTRSKSTNEIDDGRTNYKFDNDKPIDNHLSLQSISFGEIAALRFCAGKIFREIDNLSKLKLPQRCQFLLIQVIKHDLRMLGLIVKDLLPVI